MSNHNQNHDQEGQYPDATYLYIRTNLADTGAEPLASGLAWWQSPDIVIVQPGGARGGDAVANAENHVEVTVTNAGGIIANDAFVDVFFGDPSTVMTPATTSILGGTYVTVPAIGTATVSFSWTPTAMDAGHRCLIARVSLVIPPDTYADPATFNVPGDRHVAQRNIHVLAMAAAMKSMSFSFRVANPDEDRVGNFLLEATEVTGKEGALQVAWTVGCEVPLRLADGALGGISINLDRKALENRPTLVGATRVPLGVLKRPIRPSGEASSQVQLAPAAACMATVTIDRNPDAKAGEISAVDVRQVEAGTGRVLGGITLVVLYT
jgi:hypothetical protein